MTVESFLGFMAELRGMRGDARKKAIHRVVEMCFLESVLYQSVDTLSKGYRHRTCFAQSIIHDPDVLVLDEPTDGLDPNQKHEVRGLIRRMGERKAIIFSTHILEEVEAVCSRAIIIDRGKIVANGTPEQLKQKSDFAGRGAADRARDAWHAIGGATVRGGQRAPRRHRQGGKRQGLGAGLSQERSPQRRPGPQCPGRGQRLAGRGTAHRGGAPGRSFPQHHSAGHWKRGCEMNSLANIKTITKRELGGYFSSPVAYVFIVIFLLLTGFFTFTGGRIF